MISMYRKLIFIIVSVLVMASSGWAKIQVCPVQLNKVVSSFGPELVSTGYPFHYNFKLQPPFVVDFEEQQNTAFINELGGVLESKAFYAYNLDSENIFYRVMFVPKQQARPGFYKSKVKVTVLNKETGEHCLLSLPVRTIELVYIAKVPK